MTRITDIRTVGIPVSDQERALAFYLDELGFEKRMDAEFAPGQRWVEVAAPGAATSVALVAASGDAPAGVDTGIRFTTEDADADHASLLAGGVDVDPEVLRFGGVPPMFAFRDPDGNRLVVVQSR
ncbi:MAG TPA: VOC family protein [Candidatus Dormibacteraeota bacterium]|jgi:predicted enzyme related to lactoylglutathione lyase